MADLTGFPSVFAGDTSVVDTSLQHQLGTRAMDADGNEYIYLQGVASTVAGSWVSFDEDHVTTLLAANAVGRVAVAMAAIVADSYGWYQIYGKNEIAKADTTADGAGLFIDNTAGQVDDAGVAGDWICGAISRSATSGGVITCELSYPSVCNNAYLT